MIAREFTKETEPVVADYYSMKKIEIILRELLVEFIEVFFNRQF